MGRSESASCWARLELIGRKKALEMMFGTCVLLAAEDGRVGSTERLEGARRLAGPVLVPMRDELAVMFCDSLAGGSPGSPTGPVVDGIATLPLLLSC